MAGSSRCTAGQRVRTTRTAAMPPKRIASTPATAWTLMSRSAVRCTLSPVWAQVRKVVASMPRLLLDDDLADHRVMADAAELVAHGEHLARFRGGHRQHVLVAREHHEVEVEREEREAVQEVHRGEVQPVGLALLELQHGVPRPHPPEHVDVLARLGRDHRDPLVLAHLVLLDVGVHLRLVGERGRAVRLEGGVLLPGEVPEGHHREEDEAPHERDADPELLGRIDLLPPHALQRLDAHGAPLPGDGDARDLEQPPDGVEHDRDDDADQQQEEDVVEDHLHQRRPGLVVALVSHASALHHVVARFDIVNTPYKRVGPGSYDAGHTAHGSLPARRVAGDNARRGLRAPCVARPPGGGVSGGHLGAPQLGRGRDDVLGRRRVGGSGGPSRGPPARRSGGGMTAEQVREALRDVLDPELGINVVDLGLVYAVDVQDGQVRVTMTMTSPACPLGESLTAEAEAAIRRSVPGVTAVTVELVWDPPWQPAMMSEATRTKLGWSS